MLGHKLPYANKDLGQHFLTDQKIIEKITSPLAEDVTGILEIGPGPGILSEKLAQKNLPYHVVEKDQRFLPYLEKFLSPHQITLTDALALDLGAFINKLYCKTQHILVVSNLPYNISVPLALKFVNISAIKSMTLMFQKEVALRIYGNTKKKSMGSLMALIQTYFNITPLCQVPPEAFTPPPQVDSTVLSFSRKSDNDCAIPLQQFKRFEIFLRLLFSMRRKQVGNILKNHFHEESIEKALTECNIKKTDRAETFNLMQVQLLYGKLERKAVNNNLK